MKLIDELDDIGRFDVGVEQPDSGPLARFHHEVGGHRIGELVTGDKLRAQVLGDDAHQPLGDHQRQA